jgi:uncharacterized protein YcaQ
MKTPEQLRALSISRSLFGETTLKVAIRRLGFVQADPIRSPARAQDLILRHRVKGYRVGDLDRRYPSLDLEEDVLYAYGFLPRRVWQLLHPRKMKGISSIEGKVLEAVRAGGVTHPRELTSRFGKRRVTNAWGGHSQATTRALEALRAGGRLRVARREHGIRLYEAMPSWQPLSPDDRLPELIMVVANILAPVTERTLYANIARYRFLGDTRATVGALVTAGRLRTETIDGLSYIWPSAKTVPAEIPRRVRFLAPFDPLVWDRRRFEHLWGWSYRFEAYTPAAKRLRGYYAMPLLWGDAVVGWANARVRGPDLDVEVGFVKKRPRDSNFGAELEAEIERLRTFLRLE